jgi:truncated hemoglobin YjbI
MLRRPHLPCTIGHEERDPWLLNMRRALEETLGESRCGDFWRSTDGA